MTTEALPANVGRYKILSLLGAGAMGKVWLAEDPRIKRHVAIKTLRLDLFQREEDREDFLARFSREAEISGLLNDPGIVTIYDVGESELGPFMAMEYVKGKSLDHFIKSGPPLSLSQKLRILAGTAQALDHAHAAGIIHRDVKPGNVMIQESGRPKLMDFGIAKREDSTLTQTGTFLGTPSYVSPEQVRGNPIDPRSDLFSFAVMSFELLTGVLPFSGNSINTLLYNIVNEPPAEVPREVPGIVSERLHRVFGRALAKAPDARHLNCCAFVQDLLNNCVEVTDQERKSLEAMLRAEDEDPFSEPSDSQVPRQAPTPKARPVSRKGPVLLLSGLGVALLCVSAFWVRTRGAQPKVEGGGTVPTQLAPPVPKPAVPEPGPGPEAPAAPQHPQVPAPQAVPTAQEGSLRVTGTFPVRVRLRGQDLGEFGSGKALSLAEGTHQLELSAPKVYFKERRTVHILKGIPTSIFLPTLVKVKINTTPEYGLVVIDGIPTHVESTGSEVITLAAGSHTIGFEGKTAQKTLEIQKDGMIAFNLE